MKIERFIEHSTNTQTYLIYSDSGQALIIDPVYSEYEKYIDYLNKNNLTLNYCFDTHIHADHITASSKLCNKLGCKIAMSEHAVAKNIDLVLTDNQELNLDNIVIKIIYTPGHTVESCCYLVNNNHLFTGDTLLINACGRTDFQNGSASQLYDSIFNKILNLPGETIIYPGHDYNNRLTSTISDEKINNPRLQVSNKQEFIDIMDNLNLDKPTNIDIAVPRNLVCGDDI